MKYSDIGMSFEDLSSIVFVTLKSTREYSEQQSDLFELLKFDGFEAIPTLLENRKQLVSNVTTITVLHAGKKECWCTINNQF